MSKSHADYLTAGNALVGDDFEDAPNVYRRWNCIQAIGGDVTIQVTAPFWTLDDGSTALPESTSLVLADGEKVEGFFTTVECVVGSTGKALCYRCKALPV